jgi:hypothetical protein
MKRTFTAGLAALMLIGLAAPAGAEPRFAPIPKAVIADPARDAAHPADMAAFTVPTGGVRVNAMMYLASGDQPHPTMLMLHGFPGNETNIDLMQAVRRAGWNVMRINYRGSWGSPGKFSFAKPAPTARRPWPSCSIRPTSPSTTSTQRGSWWPATAWAASWPPTPRPPIPAWPGRC